MSRVRAAALLAWLGTLLLVSGVGALAVRAAGVGTVATTALSALVLVVSLLCAGAVLVALRTRWAPLAACTTDRPGSGCGACGQACLKAGTSAG
jgi:hypothetical protein